MKKKFKDTKFGKVAKKIPRIGLDLLKGGLLDPFRLTASPIVGAVAGLIEGQKQGISNVKRNNIESEGGGYGKLNITRLTGLIIFVGLVLLYVFDVIDQTTFEIIFNRLTELIK